jgi:hypothetical protein
MQPIHFQAPWSRSLRISSIVITIMLCAVVTTAILTAVFAGNLAIHIWVIAVGLPVGMLMVALPFSIRGYVLTEDEIQIKRLGWMTHLPVKTLNAVEGKADAMSDSIRVFGNAGFFAFTGLYWNRMLRFYRVYATDPSRAVILRYANKTVVITPHDPQAFIMRARTLIKTRDFPR